LFVPWEDFLSSSPDDYLLFWESALHNLPERLKFNVRNISLLRRSADDAKADPKHFKNFSDGDHIIAVGSENYTADNVEEEFDEPKYERNFMAFQSVITLSLQDVEVTSWSPELSQILQTTSLAQENFRDEDWRLL
jgi:hypothetical protein